MEEKELKDAESWVKSWAKQVFEEEIKKGGYIKTWIAKVNAYDSVEDTADVYLPDDVTNIIPDIKNKSGVSLSVGDKVELYSRLGTLGSSYIAVKY